MITEYIDYTAHHNNFWMGAASCFNLTPIYPTNFINTYCSYPDSAYVDYLEIYDDWRMVGEDINKAGEDFGKEMQIDSARREY